MQKGLAGCVIRQLVDLVDNKLALGEGVPSDFVLEEDTEHAQRRLDFTEQIAKLRDAKARIDKMQLPGVPAYTKLD